MSQSRFPTASERAKRARLLEMLDDSWVMVHLDPSVEGVDLPAHLRDEPQVALNVGYALGSTAFEVAPLEIRALLTFGSERHRCVVPLAAVFALLRHADGDQIVFSESVPAALLRAQSATDAEGDEPGPPDAESADEGGDDAGDGDDKGGGGPPHLRLVT